MSDKDEKISVEKMKKHLRLYNKNVRDDLIISGLAKMKKEEVKKKFNQRFYKSGSHYVPSGSETNFTMPDNIRSKMIEESKKIMVEKRKAKPKPKPKPEPKKIKVKRRVKGGKVVGGSVDGKEI